MREPAFNPRLVASGSFRLGAEALVVALLASAVSACSAIRFGEEEVPFSGIYVGAIAIEDQTIEGTLTLVQSGADLQATLSAPALGLNATGNGTLQVDRFRLILEYNLRCPGVIRLVGSSGVERTLAGTAEATDCTGPVEGAFNFRPRTPTAPDTLPR